MRDKVTTRPLLKRQIVFLRAAKAGQVGLDQEPELLDSIIELLTGELHRRGKVGRPRKWASAQERWKFHNERRRRKEMK